MDIVLSAGPFLCVLSYILRSPSDGRPVFTLQYSDWRNASYFQCSNLFLVGILLVVSQMRKLELRKVVMTCSGTGLVQERKLSASEF